MSAGTPASAKHRLVLVLPLLAFVACSTAASPTTDGPDEGDAAAVADRQGTEVKLFLGEWFIAMSPREAQGGDVTFAVRNIGRVVHEIEVLRKVGEHSDYEVAELEDVAPGETMQLDLQLAPGTYELVCTIVERLADGNVYNHYRLGMSTIFHVPESLVSRP